MARDRKRHASTQLPENIWNDISWDANKEGISFAEQLRKDVIKYRRKLRRGR
jgi:hypothetical protein